MAKVKKMKLPSKLRNVCFTVYTLEQLTILSDPRVRYYVFQREVCPTTGRLHWQGYIEFNTTMRIDAVKKILGDKTAHLENRSGTAEEAADYCKKLETGVPNTLVEWGEISKQGVDKDMQEVIQDIREGKEDESHDVYIMRFPNGYKTLKRKYEKFVHRDKFQGWILFGDSGAGKSKLAEKRWPDAYWAKDTIKPNWVGYKGQKTIIFNEFRGRLEFTEFLRLCDTDPMEMDVKFDHANVKANQVVLISNRNPNSWYAGGEDEEVWQARMARDFDVEEYRGLWPNSTVKIKKRRSLESIGTEVVGNTEATTS